MQALRLRLNEAKDIAHVLDWIKCCVLLHNMLASLGDAWRDLDVKEVTPARRPGPPLQRLASQSPRDFGLILREAVRDHAVSHGYLMGVLPIKK